MKTSWKLLSVFCVCVTSNAAAVNLLDVYSQSLTADPLWQQATYIQRAVRETKTQALLNLLPLDVSANKNWAAAGGTTLNGPGYVALNLSVNLFSWDSWVALKSADATVAQSEANYRAAAQSLIQRVTQQYFAVLAAQDILLAQQSALKSVQSQVDQAEKGYDAGLISHTDVEAARASRDSTAAAVIAAKRTLATQQNLLRAITNESYSSLGTLRDDMPLLTPEPASEDAWVRVAMNQNASLIASRMAAEVAHDSLLTAYGGHLPSLYISATRNWALQHVNPNDPIISTIPALNVAFPNNTTDIVWQIGVTVPIFSAGATQSKVRQASLFWDAAKSGADQTSRQTEEQTRDSYQGVISQIAQIGARKRAFESNRVSLEAAQAGYEAGTKTVVDVLTSRDALVQAELSYAQAKYDYLNDIVLLRLAAGTLDQSVIEQINSWLVEPASAAGSGGT
ncbi:MAG: TolC family protein [Steroidobacteraceae bacterium]